MTPNSAAQECEVCGCPRRTAEFYAGDAGCRGPEPMSPDGYPNPIIGAHQWVEFTPPLAPLRVPLGDLLDTEWELI